MHFELLKTNQNESLTTIVAVVACMVTLVGVLLWLAGARYSKTIITLILVSAGSAIGLQMPAWFGWHIEGWATALGASLILGASGFFLHRMWVGVAFGAVLAGWAAFLTWNLYGGGLTATWNPPTLAPELLNGISSVSDLVHRFPWSDYARALWETVPLEVQHRLPYACGGGMILGFVVSLLLPRIGIVLLYSTAGVSILAAMGVYARETGISWVSRLPNRTPMQVAMLLAMVAFGAILQWQIATGPSSSRSKARRSPMVIDD